MTHRRSHRSALGALAVAACLVISSCSHDAVVPASANPPGSTVPGTVHAASSEGSPVAALELSTERATALSEPAVDDTPSSTSSTEAHPGPAASVGATDACSLVTEQEATTALGTDPGPGTRTALQGTATACTYRTGGSTLQFSLTPSDGKATFDQGRAHIPSAAASLITDMPGIGDNACGQFQGPRGAINFDKGDALIVMGLNLAGATDPPRNQLTVLAIAAAGRI